MSQKSTMLPVVQPTSCVFAHSANTLGIRHDLTEHLVGTANRARSFGEPFGQADACFTAGLWHDIGKVASDFQAYLAACETPSHPPRGPNHKDAAAVLAASAPSTAHLAPLLLGHHGGIPDLGNAAYMVQAARRRGDVTESLDWARAFLPEAPVCAEFQMSPAPTRDILLRLTYSALVDADFLDTEAHFDAGRADERGRLLPSMDELDRRERRAYKRFLSERGPATRVDDIRAEIRNAAVSAALLEPGLFRLTVPTGGGKTMSGLAFALRHAAHWGLRRVIVAVPFLTITDQTATVYRSILGTDAVLEHHSAIDPQRDGDAHGRIWSRLASENWDAAVVVTTTIQLFESLFSNRPSHLRKAHRLARSVVILDEAQALPLRLLGVTTDALSALARAAGTTIVLCSATQPALEEVDHSMSGYIREIVPAFADHFTALRRVVYSVPAQHEAWSWEKVATAARSSDQTLVVVNTRRDALAVLARLDGDAHHLSTLLCGAHRRRVLAEVRDALTAHRRCHLVSTQIVEAGVDIDFPLVLRALAPFDSVVQAGGRCNREGRLHQGRCIVFRSEERDTFGAYRRGADTLAAMLEESGRAERDLDFGDPAVCREYYRRLYGSGTATAAVIDPDGLRGLVDRAMFDTVAAKYHIIDEATSPIVVLYPPKARQIDRLLHALDRTDHPEWARRLLRQLQPYIVSLRQRDIEVAHGAGLIGHRGGIPVWKGDYNMRTGVAQILDRQGMGAGTPAGSNEGGYVI